MRGNIICLLSLVMVIPWVMFCFNKFGAARGVLIAFFGAVLFLPMEELQVPLILYNKMTATGMGVMLAIQVTDPEAMEEFQLSLLDVPMLVWLFSVILSSILNGLGIKDGLQESFNTFTLWGVPFLAGRLYFTTPKRQLLLCRTLFICGLLYIPFVAFELIMSPQAHRIVYGYMQHSFAQVIRGGGYRPMVFMQHGIMLGTFMCMAAMVGIWCTANRVFPKKMFGIPTWLLALGLLGSSIACKSSGAIGLMFMGLMALFISSRLKTALIIWMMLMIPPAYIATRATGYWDGQNAVDLITEKFSADRAASLAFRFDNENILVEKALERPVFGWGGWGRSRVYDPDTGEDLSTTDGFWIIVLGSRGYIGLISVSLVLLLPMVLFILKYHPRTWTLPEVVPGAAIAIIPLIFLIDCTLNAMVNQMYIIFAGGITGMMLQPTIKTADEDDKKSADSDEPRTETSSGDAVPVRAAAGHIRPPRFVLHTDYTGPRFSLTPANGPGHPKEMRAHESNRKTLWSRNKKTTEIG